MMFLMVIQLILNDLSDHIQAANKMILAPSALHKLVFLFNDPLPVLLHSDHNIMARFAPTDNPNYIDGIPFWWEIPKDSIVPLYPSYNRSSNFRGPCTCRIIIVSFSFSYKLVFALQESNSA
jgi:hypothetical protein